MTTEWMEEMRTAKALVKTHWDPEDWKASPETWELASKLASTSGRAASGTLPARPFGRDSFADIPPEEPAVLSGLMSSGWDLEALRIESLQSLFPNARLLLTTAMDTPDQAVKVSCGAFVNYMLAQSQPGADADEEPLAIFDRDMIYDDPLFAALYSVPDVPSLQFRDMSLDRLPSYVRTPLRYFLLGPSRSGTEMHRDPKGTVAWNALAHGRKRWAFLDPRALEELAMRQNPPEGLVWSIAEWFDNEWPKICEDATLNGLRTFDFEQSPHEVVYTPVGWWHAVLNLEPSVAITHNVMSHAVFDTAIQGVPHPVEGEVSEAMVEAVTQAFDLHDQDGEVKHWLETLYEDVDSAPLFR